MLSQQEPFKIWRNCKLIREKHSNYFPQGVIWHSDLACKLIVFFFQTRITARVDPRPFCSIWDCEALLDTPVNRWSRCTWRYNGADVGNVERFQTIFEVTSPLDVVKYIKNLSFRFIYLLKFSNIRILQIYCGHYLGLREYPQLNRHWVGGGSPFT